jgi:glycine cleavage system pyridoxal-binding protein P
VALRCARGARYCRQALLGLDGVTPLTGDTPVVREFAVHTPVPAATVIDRLAEEGFLAGVALDALTGGEDPSCADPAQALLVAVTERRTARQIDTYVTAFDKAVRS